MRLALTERQKEVATGLVIIAVFVLGLGGGEAAMRLIEIVRFGAAGAIEKAETFHIDAETGLRLPVPGSVHGGAPISSLGFRSPEIRVPKPEGAIRLAFLGNSVTYDAYVSGGQTWPLKTTEALAAAFPECAIDHVNAGVPGFASDRYLVYYGSRVAATEPDIVVIMPGDVNHDADEYVVDRGLHDGVHHHASWLARHSLLWEKVEKNLRIISLQRAAFHPTGKIPIDADEIVPRFKERLRALVGRIRSDGALPVLVTPRSRIRPEQTDAEKIEAAGTALYYMPYMSIDHLLELGEAYNEATAAIAAATGVPLIASADFGIPGTAEYYKDSAHFSALGSATFGEKLAPALADLPAVRRLLDACPKGAGN
jgi:lysophospholipase L1-like esterase